MPDSPEWTLNSVVRYSVPVSDRMNMMFMVDCNYMDDVYKNVDNDEHLPADSCWLWNARGQFSTPINTLSLGRHRCTYVARVRESLRHRFCRLRAQLPVLSLLPRVFKRL